MERIISKIKKVFVTACMAIFMCVLFVSCYTMNEFNNSLWLSRAISVESYSKSSEYYKTSGNMKSGKLDWDVDHGKVEYVDLDKYYLKSLLKLYGMSQLYAMIICSIIMPFILILLVMRGWRIKVSNFKILLMLVRFIQSKDGKKDARSFSYIF
jgi:hypothetical protein